MLDLGTFYFKMVSKHPRNPKHVQGEEGKEEESSELENSEEQKLENPCGGLEVGHFWRADTTPLQAWQALPQGETWVQLDQATPQNLVWQQLEKFI